MFSVSYLGFSRTSLFHVAVIVILCLRRDCSKYVHSKLMSFFHWGYIKTLSGKTSSKKKVWLLTARYVWFHMMLMIKLFVLNFLNGLHTFRYVTIAMIQTKVCENKYCEGILLDAFLIFLKNNLLSHFYLLLLHLFNKNLLFFIRVTLNARKLYAILWKRYRIRTFF